MLQTPIQVSPSNGKVLHVEDRVFETRFTFQGDMLTFVQGQVCDPDMVDGNIYKYRNYNMPKDGHLNHIYNGQTVAYSDWIDHWIADHLVPGSNPQHKFRLFQHYPDNLPDAKKPMADIYFGRGKIDDHTGLESYQTKIAPYLSNIREPYYYSWTDEEEVEHRILCGAIFMEIGHEMHMIGAYNWYTGVVDFHKVTYHELVEEDYTVLEVASVSNDTTIPASYKTEGQPYKLFTNYLETGWYDFKWRHKPVTSTSIIKSVDNTEGYHDYVTDKWQHNGFKTFNGIEYESTYSQAENIGLKWFQYEIYQLDEDVGAFDQYTEYEVGDLTIHSGKLYICIQNTTLGSIFDPSEWELADPTKYGRLIEQTDREYTYELRHTLPIDPYAHDYVVRLITCTQDDDVTTLDMATVKQEENIPDADGHEPLYLGININGKPVTIDNNNFSMTISDSAVIKLNWEWDGYGFYTSVFRREIYPDGTLAPTATYIGTKGGELQLDPICDYTASNNSNYRYELLTKSAVDSEFGKPIAMHYIYNVNTKWDGWHIFKAMPTEDYSNNNRQGMYVSEEWKFISDIDSGDITHNINPVQHVGTGNYSKTVRVNNKFESGSFSANLLTIECPDNEILDNIQRVKAWIKFISGENPFLLKSEKGDVWVVNITQNPTRQYEETYDPIWTKVHYEWAECANYEKCTFMQEK